MGANPVASQETGNLRAVQSTRLPVVDVFGAGVLLEARQLQQAGQAAIVAAGAFVIDEQAQTFVKGEFAAGGLLQLSGIGLGHAGQLEPAQRVEGVFN